MEVEKYKVMSSVGEGKEFMNGIEFDFVIENEDIGQEVNCLGDTFTITQNGKILVLVNSDWVLTIMKQPKPEEEINLNLEPNVDYDVFFETKTFKIHETDLVKRGVSYEKFFETLRDEWSTIEKIRNTPFPMKFDYDFNSLVFTHGWDWESDDYTLLNNGSWGREDKDGRSI